jgi:hypothetical protein
MIHFPNTTLHRYTYTEAGEGVYGENIFKYEYADDIFVDFQNETNNEIAHQYGVDLQNLYKIYADHTVQLNDTDQLQDGEGNVYHIVGNVRYYSHFHKFLKANLVLERRTSVGGE